MATCEYTSNAPGDRGQLDYQVQAQLLRAIRDVVARKMESRELTFRHLGTGDVGAVVPEIVAASGLAQMGVGVGSLQMAFGIDGHAPQPPRGAPAPQHDVAKGRFDLGDGHQLQVKINGKTPEGFLKDKASSMIWGWIIGAVIIGIFVLTAIGVGIWVWMQSRSMASGGSAKAVAAKWDGKSTFACGGNDVVALTGIKATAGVKAGGNCQLTLSGVDITAPVAIDASANAVVTMTGGSITASQSSVVASAGAKVNLVGTKVSGKAKTSGAAKVTGAP